MLSNTNETSASYKKAPYASECSNSTYRPYVVMTYKTDISLNYTSTSIVEGGTRTLVATTSPSGQSVTWSTSNSAVATVDSNGVIKGVSTGTTTITGRVYRDSSSPLLNLI